MKETTIPQSDMDQVMFDAIHEPHEICNWDKRRKCDSYYIELYKQQQKKIDKALKYIDNCIGIEVKEELRKILGDKK